MRGTREVSPGGMFSDEEVEEAMKKLKDSSGESRKTNSTRDSDMFYQYLGNLPSQRQYDWRSEHFYPDIHRVDTTRYRPTMNPAREATSEPELSPDDNLLLEQNGDSSIHHGAPDKDYVPNEDVKLGTRSYYYDSSSSDEENRPPLTLDVCIGIEHQRQHLAKDMGQDSSAHVDLDSEDSVKSSPKIWRKSPLHVKKGKKHDDRPSSGDRTHAGVSVARDTTQQSARRGPGGSPMLRRNGEASQNKRSPRRLSAPIMYRPASPRRPRIEASIQRRNSDIQEKFQKFEELQQRRRALETTSDESIPALTRRYDYPDPKYRRYWAPPRERYSRRNREPLGDYGNRANRSHSSDNWEYDFNMSHGRPRGDYENYQHYEMQRGRQPHRVKVDDVWPRNSEQYSQVPHAAAPHIATSQPDVREAETKHGDLYEHYIRNKTKQRPASQEVLTSQLSYQLPKAQVPNYHQDQKLQTPDERQLHPREYDHTSSPTRQIQMDPNRQHSLQFRHGQEKQGGQHINLDHMDQVSQPETSLTYENGFRRDMHEQYNKLSAASQRTGLPLSSYSHQFHASAGQSPNSKKPLDRLSSFETLYDKVDLDMHGTSRDFVDYPRVTSQQSINMAAPKKDISSQYRNEVELEHEVYQEGLKEPYDPRIKRPEYPHQQPPDFNRKQQNQQDSQRDGRAFQIHAIQRERSSQQQPKMSQKTWLSDDLLDAPQTPDFNANMSQARNRDQGFQHRQPPSYHSNPYVGKYPYSDRFEADDKYTRFTNSDPETSRPSREDNYGTEREWDTDWERYCQRTKDVRRQPVISPQLSPQQGYHAMNPGLGFNVQSPTHPQRGRYFPSVKRRQDGDLQSPQSTSSDEKKRKENWGAKELMQEESEKYAEYKAEYTRRLSERTTSSEDEHPQSPHERERPRIPPDEYDYVLRRVVHQRQQAIYVDPFDEPKDVNASQTERIGPTGRANSPYKLAPSEKAAAGVYLPKSDQHQSDLKGQSRSAQAKRDPQREFFIDPYAHGHTNYQSLQQLESMWGVPMNNNREQFDLQRKNPQGQSASDHMQGNQEAHESQWDQGRVVQKVQPYLRQDQHKQQENFHGRGNQNLFPTANEEMEVSGTKSAQESSKDNLKKTEAHFVPSRSNERTLNTQVKPTSRLTVGSYPAGDRSNVSKERPAFPKTSFKNLKLSTNVQRDSQNDVKQETFHPTNEAETEEDSQDDRYKIDHAKLAREIKEVFERVQRQAAIKRQTPAQATSKSTVALKADTPSHTERYERWMRDRKSPPREDPENVCVSVSAIKASLFGEQGEQPLKAEADAELSNLVSSLDHKVTNIRSNVFNSKDEDVTLLSPKHQPLATVGASGDDDYIIDYVSYKDGKEPKRSNVNDALTELERVYEQLNLDNDDSMDADSRRDYLPFRYAPVHKTLSSENLRKLDYINSKNEDTPSMQYAKHWLAADNGAFSNKKGQETKFGAPHSDICPAKSAAPHDTPDIAKIPLGHKERLLQIDQQSVGSGSQRGRSPLPRFPRKLTDDMSYRRHHTPGGRGLLDIRTPTSFISLSPGMLTPATSIDSLARRAATNLDQSRSPDPSFDDVLYRNIRGSPSGPRDQQTVPNVSPSPTTADYLQPRTTSPKRGRMRIRPDREADKYHDDFAYRQLRKDVPPVQTELPKAFKNYQDQRTRSLSLERGIQENGKDQSVRKPVPQRAVKRSSSVGPLPKGQRRERRSSLSKGIAKMVELFSSPMRESQSAPDLREQTVFSDNYDAHGELVGDESKKYSKQTPRTVKHRNEWKSKLRPACTRANADSSFDSETDHSSSGMEMDQFACRPPPDGGSSENLKKQDSSPKSESPKVEEGKLISSFEHTKEPSVSQISPQPKTFVSRDPRVSVQQTEMQRSQPTVREIHIEPVSSLPPPVPLPLAHLPLDIPFIDSGDISDGETTDITSVTSLAALADEQPLHSTDDLDFSDYDNLAGTAYSSSDDTLVDSGNEMPQESTTTKKVKQLHAKPPKIPTEGNNLVPNIGTSAPLATFEDLNIGPSTMSQDTQKATTALVEEPKTFSDIVNLFESQSSPYLRSAMSRNVFELRKCSSNDEINSEGMQVHRRSQTQTIVHTTHKRTVRTVREISGSEPNLAKNGGKQDKAQPRGRVRIITVVPSSKK